MSKDIKTREAVRSIKALDKNENMAFFQKKPDVSTRLEKMDNSDNKKENNQSHYATNQTINAQKKTVIGLAINQKQLSDRKRSFKAKNNTDNEAASSKEKSKFIKIKKQTREAHSKKSQKNNLYHFKPHKDHLLNQSNIHDYQHQMLQYSINKHKTKVQAAYQNKTFYHFTKQGVTNIFRGTIGVVKKTLSNAHYLVKLGIGFILMIMIVLFIGVFSALSEDSNFYDPSLYVSDEVLAYTETIERYAQEYDVEEYVTLIQAIMMQESEGKGTDPMQSSMCEYNERFPKIVNGITDPDYSIQIGVRYFAECMKLANVKDQADMDNISLALQGYDYGTEYIQWAIQHFGGYTRANAKVYSDEKKAELQIENYGDPKYVSHVLRYYHIGNGNLVMIAKSQIGNVGGKKYWSWYGYEHRVEWCAVFVSWCANESGQLNITIPKFAVVNDAVEWYKEKGLWRDRNYTPKAGDLIFFDWEQDGRSNHVGIVEKVEGNYAYTIEGNSNDECIQRVYTLADYCIFGYGVII